MGKSSDRGAGFIYTPVHSLGVAEEYRILTSSGQLPKLDLYDKDLYIKKDTNTFKPILAGLLLIIPGIMMIILNTFYSNLLTQEIFILALYSAFIICDIISIVGGIFAVKRIKHRFALLSSFIGLIGLNPLGIISFILLMMSDDEFTS